MFNKIGDHYRREVPYLILPLSLFLTAVLILRFILIPEIEDLQSNRINLKNISRLQQEKQALLIRIQVSLSKMRPLPSRPKISVSDETALLEELFTIAARSGVTLNRTIPARADGNYSVQTGCSSTWNGIIRFLRELETYSSQITITSFSLNRSGSLIDISLTIQTISPEGKQ